MSCSLPGFGQTPAHPLNQQMMVALVAPNEVVRQPICQGVLLTAYYLFLGNIISFSIFNFFFAI